MRLVSLSTVRFPAVSVASLRTDSREASSAKPDDRIGERLWNLLGKTLRMYSGAPLP